MSIPSRHSENQDPLISVVICTRNRANLLSKAIASVVGQDFPQDDYEILVVDNGSTDHTVDIIQQFQAEHQVRYLHEAEVGLCAARNTAWRGARGRYVAYFDDDAIALPGWLAAIRDGFAQAPPQIGAIGGRVDPLWEKPRPEWLSDSIACSLTIVDWGDSDKTIEDLNREWLVGTNLALPRELLSMVGGFHPWLDRIADNLLSSGDVFLQKELIRRGYRCYYRPTMRIQHLIAADRVQPQWFLRRYFWQGVSDALMLLIEKSPKIAERISLANSRSGSLRHQMRILQAPLLAADNADAFTRKCLALVDVGFVAALLGGAGR